ncbi:MAG: chromosomal replication initiator protein DnaA [Fimbriimonadaceae bacterium]|nr:chromosomal replication initiator protein DnaA [Fimbriimonadaceae bacterium]
MNDLFSTMDPDPMDVLVMAWRNVVDRLSTEIPQTWMDKFVRRLKPVALDGSDVHLQAQGKFVFDWVSEHMRGSITTFLSDELGRDIEVKLTYTATTREEASAPAVVTREAAPKHNFRPDPRYTFESFVQGNSNRLALAGARAVADAPGKTFNPLFIYGASGLGKTHLLHAIANQVLARDPRVQIEYLSAQQFTEEFVTAIHTNRIDAFRRQIRNAHVWLLDDVQAILNRDRTEEEIFNTFNYLHQNGRQIVVTADRLPSDFFSMNVRLRSRFEAGLVADVQLPDTETRCAIVQSKAVRDGIPLNHDVAWLLAETVPGNIRTLEGALTRLVALASLDQLELTTELARTMVAQYYKPEVVKVSFQQIIETVSRVFDVPCEQILGDSRKAPIVQARHAAIYVVRRTTADSWKHIGSQFGDRDHTSMMHAYQRVESRMESDTNFKASIETVMRRIDPSP